MLKISTDVEADIVFFVLEGSLSGPWIREVEHAWEKAALAPSARRAKFDLSGVTFVSQEGKQLLERICAAGAELVSSDLSTKSLLDEISDRHRNAGRH